MLQNFKFSTLKDPMFVSLSITLKTFKFLSLLEARAATSKGGQGGGAPQAQSDNSRK